MRININELVTIDIISPPKNHREFLTSEYEFVEERPILEDNPDVRVVFVENKTTDFGNCVIVKAPLAYDKQGVFWFDPNHQVCRIDFRGFFESTTQLVADKNFNPNFMKVLIEYIIGIKVMNNGGTFCHASAAIYKSRVILFPAWRHVGKTNLLLKILEDGAELIADDGVILFENGNILPYSKRMHLLYYNILEHPEMNEIVDDETKLLMEFIQNAHDKRYTMKGSSVMKLQSLIRARVLNSSITKSKYYARLHKCDMVIHLNKTLDNRYEKIKLKEIETGVIAEKLTSTMLFEFAYFFSAYRISKLITSTTDPVIDKVEDKVKQIIENSLLNIGHICELKFNSLLNSQDAKEELDSYINEAR